MSSPSKPTEPAASIDDLPPEMICELFEYLQPKDLAACSMVNKRWHSIYSGFKVHRLAVVYEHWHYSSKWCYPKRRIEENELCQSELFYRLADKPLLSNLKHLALCDDSLEFDPNKLNRFSQLVHLEINLEGSLFRKKVNLNLHRLEVLAISWNDSCPLSIDCPNLNVLEYDEPSNKSLLDVKQPETIRKLETKMVGLKLARFKSVECLLTREFELISKATLIALPKLKELHYNASIAYSSPADTLDRMKRTLGEFLDDVKVLRGSDFKFRFAGFQLTKTMLDEIDFGVHRRIEDVCNEYVYMKNYQLIDPDGILDFVHMFDYNRLMDNVTGAIPSCFSKKFTFIAELHAHRAIPDANGFLWFVNSLRSLRGLYLDSSELGQEFYDQLPASAPLLVTLKMWNDNPNQDELQLSFDFIGKFSHLSGFGAYHQELTLESLKSLVKWLGKLAEIDFGFRLNGKQFITERLDFDGSWKVRELDRGEWRKIFVTEELDEIVHYFETLLSDPPKSGQATG